jgi:hypothetical protein
VAKHKSESVSARNVRFECMIISSFCLEASLMEWKAQKQSIPAS